MSGIVRNATVSARLGPPGDSVVIALAGPPRVQQQLEGAVTTVAELTLAGTTPALSSADPLRLWHVNRGSLPDPDYDARQMFSGVVKTISGVGSPYGVTLSCTGTLANLRRIRTSDYHLAGKTDVEVVKHVLDFCDIPYLDADIRGWGYEFGTADTHGDTEAEPLWRTGQSGAALIAEIDRVFGTATIEGGDGRIEHFPYSLAPARYTDITGARTFTRGQAGVAFYGNERARGDVDRVINRWVVRGLSYTWGEDTTHEGCRSTYVATGTAEHAVLGPGINVGTQEFQSSLIDSEALAKAVAIRLLQWSNREPDTVRIQCGNDLRIGPGAIILVKDPTYGIDLITTTRYLVTGVARDGDLMVLDAIGGPTGETGTITSQLLRECNETTTDEGTNPPAYDPPDPFIPSFPPIDDIPVTDLPPIEEPTTPGDSDELAIDCEEQSGGLNDPAFSSDVPWRTSALWYMTLEVDEEIPVGEPGHFMIGSLALADRVGLLFYNTTETGTDKTEENDVVFPKNEVVSLTGRIKVNYPGTSFNVTLQPALILSSIDVATVTYRVDPGLEVPPHDGLVGAFPGGTFNLFINSENQSYGYPGIPTDVIGGDNGGLVAAPMPVEEFFDFSVTFDVASAYQTVQVSAADGSAVMHDQEVWHNPGLPEQILTYDDCDHEDGHKLVILVTAPLAVLDDPRFPVLPVVEFEHLSIGVACTVNPDYVRPQLPGDF